MQDPIQLWEITINKVGYHENNASTHRLYGNTVDVGQKVTDLLLQHFESEPSVRPEVKRILPLGNVDIVRQ